MQVFACYTVRVNTHSSGTAYSGSAAASGVPADNFAAAGSVAGTFGTSVAYNNTAYDIELVAVNIAPKPPVVKQTPPPVFTPEPKPVCNPAPIFARIQVILEACRHCPKPCLNNAMLRKQSGLENIEAFECTGNKDYLKLAIDEFDKGERDVLNGVEPDGTRTKDLIGGKTTLHQLRYAKAFCIWVLHDNGDENRKAEFAYARNNGLVNVPSCYADLNKIR